LVRRVEEFGGVGQHDVEREAGAGVGVVDFLPGCGDFRMAMNATSPGAELIGVDEL